MNPIQLELFKIDKQWQQVIRQHPSETLFLCLGERHEVNLFEAYFKYQLTEESRTDDMFLLHYQPFENGNDYGKSLVREWKEIFELWQKDTKAGVVWDVELDGNVKDYKTDAYLPVMALVKLCNLYPDLKLKKIYVQLAPTSISNVTSLTEWINEWCSCVKALDNHNIKLVYTEHHIHRTLKKIKQGTEFKLNIDVSQLMQNAAAHTNREKNDPEADYQQQILVASNYLSKGKHEQANAVLERAIVIAQKQGLQEAVVAARVMLAQSLAIKNKKSEARQQYEMALARAGERSQLSAHIHMSYGSFLLAHAGKDEAKKYFEKAIKIAEVIENDFIAMECTRLLGQLSESKITGSSKAMTYYVRCLEIAKKMPIEKRRQSSMAYTASIMLKKYGEESPEGKKLDKDMQQDYGDDWKSMAEVPANYANPLS
jgi:Tfp pilus assembly protein PilF